MNNAATNITYFWCGVVFTSPGYISRSGIAGSEGNSVFNLLRSFWNSNV